jgi:hypothetical protein
MSRWYAVKPMGMIGLGAPARPSISALQGLGFAADRLVQVHAKGSGFTGWPMGPTGVPTG